MNRSSGWSPAQMQRLGRELAAMRREERARVAKPQRRQTPQLTPADVAAREERADRHWRAKVAAHARGEDAPPRPCSVDGCAGQAAARGWCHMHWTRWRRHGDPYIVSAKAAG